VKHILVTGGAGYIGSHTAKRLANSGFQPIVLDNLSAGHRWAVKWGPLVEGDVSDEALVRRLIDKHNIEAVVHFAANAYVGESMEQPRKYFKNNVVNSLGLLHTLIECGVDKVVFSSTCATYGDPNQLPIDEDHPQRPVSPYGESKLFIEKTLRWYGEAYNLRSVCLRYFNAAGADADGELGECHNPETHLIPLVIDAAMELRPCATIFGTDYATDDGTAVRDYIHVSDLADAHVRALRYLFKGGESAAINLGTGQGRSVREVIGAVSKVSRRSVPVSERPRRAGDPAVLVADAARARTLLGWIPRYTQLDEIVHTAWAWHARREFARKSCLAIDHELIYELTGNA
jgi:UDP-glucose-4-epimerase GalE